jgi:NitT/TauT family transport system permease protein
MNTTNLRRGAAMLLPPVVLGIAMLALWQWWAVAKDIPPYVVPKPSAIWTEFTDKFDLVVDACKVTGFNALLGLILGTSFGFALAALANRFRLVNEVVDPLAVTIAAIPAVVIVGVLNRMYPLDSQIGRRIMVTLAVFFIVFVQVAKGLRQNDATQLELMRSYAATPRQILAKVRLPNTMPYLFTGIRTAVPIAVIIALVSEYFGGTQDGLGSKIASTLNGRNKALGFAYVVGGSFLGLLFFVGAHLLEYVVVPWQRRRVSR